MEARAATAAVKQETRLSDYTVPTFDIKQAHLTFEVLAGFVRVTSLCDFVRKKGISGSLVLNGSPYFDLEYIAIDGVELRPGQYDVSDELLSIENVADQFTLEIITRLKPQENSRLEGLYQSGGNLCTQCEAEGFRHITYYQDRPDVLSVFTVRIEAPRDGFPVLLSNGDLTEQGAVGKDRHYAVWHDPHPKPCYLFALVAGNLEVVSDQFVTKGGRKVALNIYVRQPDVDKCDYAMQSLKRAMQWDEDVFGLEYDLDIYNIVAVSDFNMGAMENKGLNIFNTKYVLASEDTATDADFGHVEGVIGHEYFHNWTGNRVTCRDWFQLSLKEGLTVFRDQEFSSDMASREVKRIDDVRLLRLLQFPEDGGPLAHPVRPESYFEINNFYTMTVYNKGAEVIRMMQTLLGVTVFREAVRHYLAKFDGQAVTCEDFVCAMEEQSGVDLSQFRLWYSQAGTPNVSIKRSFVEDGTILSIEQSCPDTPGQTGKKPFHMPIIVGWLDANGQSFCPEVDGDARWTEQGCLLDVTQEKQQFYFRGLDPSSVPSLLRGFTAPVKLDCDLSLQENGHLLRYDTDAYARWQAGQDLYSAYLLKSAEDQTWHADVDAVSSLTMITDAFDAILDDGAINGAFTAELLMLPSEIYLGQQQKVLDPDGIHRARESLLSELAARFREKLIGRYKQLSVALASASPNAKADRRLRNVLLGFIAQLAGEDPVGESLLLQHYSAAANMTDSMGALALIAGSDIEKRDQILEHFYDQWKHDDLVIDKWFAVQAQSKGPNTLERVTSLLDHPAFTLKNPNRLRSLISTFSMVNQVHFHEKNGRGYDLLAQIIASVDQTNPQTAAKMVAPLGRWSRLDADRKAKMISSLKALEGLKNLSKDVRELVEKSLVGS